MAENEKRCTATFSTITGKGTIVHCRYPEGKCLYQQLQEEAADISGVGVNFQGFCAKEEQTEAGENQTNLINPNNPAASSS